MSTVIGHEAIKKNMFQVLEKNQLPHALLFVGPRGVGKKAFALEFAKTWFYEK
ncbi:MAG: hypothetical protein KDD34_07080 [Bdellovibrionales bacterium]|nr:hypothetical protein [Bdellovibrionales bacterium]